MYQALYRKYRPKTFDDVVGQEVVVQTLKNSIINNKINHAYLLSGPRGCGKTTIAKIFARLVNCENPNGSNPCNECVCCTQKNEQNLDIIEMDAASNNGVDEIREINNKVNLVPSLGKYKVYIIDEVHMLTIGAFNALLKTLEEPPAHVIFILATTDPHKVPITILSRCQRFDLKKISEEKISSRLKYICEQEQIKIDDTAIKEVAHLGDGCLRDSLSILDQVTSYKPENITLEDIHEVNGTISQESITKLIEMVIDNDLTSVIKEINNYNNSGKSMIKITEEIIIYFRNLILSKTAPEIVNENINIYTDIKDKVSVENIISYIQILNQTLLDMKKFANTKMLLELAFINIIASNNKENQGSQILPIQNITRVIEKTDFPGNKTVEKDAQPEVKVDTKIVVEEEKKEVQNAKNEEKKSIKNENNKTINENVMSKLDKFIDVRVSNTLAKFSKKNTVEIKNKLENLNDYIMDEKYGGIASMILDGELKAMGDEYIIFTYNTINLTNTFNQNISIIEELLKNIFEFSCKVVAVDNLKWDEIKENFNSKKINYTYVEETESIENILKELNQTEEDNMQSLFGDLVEYK